MKKRTGFLLTSCILLTLASCKNQPEGQRSETSKYQATWESLAAVNEEPDWFRDAKLGIYFHWGVYTVPAFGTEWYPRWMHFEDRAEYNYHVDH